MGLRNQKTKKLIVYGAGETGILAHEYFTHDSEYEVVAFTLDSEFISEATMEGLPVVPFESCDDLFPPAEFSAFAAAGSGKLNRTRASMYRRLKAKGYACASYVSSRAFVWRNVAIGENCLILEDNTLQPFTAIGNNVVLWSGNHVGHRSAIHDDCFVTSHVVVSGFCNIGARSFLGVNASIADNVNVAEDNYIAMSASVQKSTEVDGVYAGVPAVRRDLSAKRFCKVREP